jgi:hypothetical protein
MINYPSDLNKSEISLYIAAFERCQELIKEKNNKTTVKEIVYEVVSRWGKIVGNEDKLRGFLLDEVKVPIDPVHIMMGEKVRDKKWFTKYRYEKQHLIEYWRRYYDYLNQKPAWTLAAVTDIDDSTDAIMNALADPKLGIKQDVRGLAFGYVQSGKTAHYLGLINKATDAGYKVIIILAGIHNNLRSQTQMRLEEEVLGYDVRGTIEDCQNVIGVGNIMAVSHHLQALTSRDENGDFNKIKAGTSINPPFIVVTKKNASVLERLIKYIGDMPISKADNGGRKRVPAEYPVLVIDDEADQASLNTKDCYNADGTLKSDFDPTKINGCIRRLLNLFECNSYVGYTATPFANIFIPPKATNNKYGDDLFPKDFIVNIPRSSTYIGALEFFGLKDEAEEIKSMPLYREISKGKDYLGKGTKKDDTVGKIPEELKTALKTFLISVAIRYLRGQRCKPNSMLIHIVRYKSQQNIVKKKIETYFTEEVCNYIKNEDKEIENDLKKIWESDFVNTTEKLRVDFSQYMKGIVDIAWNDVYTEIKRIVKDKEYVIYSINGDSDDALIYENHKGEPFNVIAIGGDKLSRGLTLEGLLVSYFTRSSDAYDTLMQMGRWFGYRPGYVDLCRLFTTKSLHGFFVGISRATEDLVRQINYMCDVVKQTPWEFGLGVESNPDLLITSKNKMRTGKDMKRDFSAHLSQTRVLDIDVVQYDDNFEAVENLIYVMGLPSTDDEVIGRCHRKVGNHKYWFGVSGYDVAQFLECYKTSGSATRANSKYMSDYIKNQITVGGVTEWTVCLINVTVPGKDGFRIANLPNEIGAGIKRENGQCTEGEAICDLHTLTSKDHEYLDYTKDQMTRVHSMQNDDKSAEEIRKVTRDRDKGLLILYPIGDVESMTCSAIKGDHKTPFAFAIVFPDRKGLGNIKSYRINDIAVERKSNDFDV